MSPVVVVGVLLVVEVDAGVGGEGDGVRAGRIGPVVLPSAHKSHELAPPCPCQASRVLPSPHLIGVEKLDGKTLPADRHKASSLGDSLLGQHIERQQIGHRLLVRTSRRWTPP